MPNWNAVLQEIASTPGSTTESNFDKVRRKYIAKLHDHTGRNVIAYYSAFLDKPRIEGVEINDGDKNGFMLCVHQLERKRGLDLFLHTPGGDIFAAESIVHYLREMFGNDIRVIVPQIAMSAGTMIACAARDIIMGKHSNLGPVDPQFSGIPAIGVLREIEMAFGDIQRDQRAALIWNPILSRLAPSFVQQCNWAVEKAESFVSDALSNGMFAEMPEPQKGATISKIVKLLSDLSNNKSHSRHFHYQECRDMGLNIKLLEDDFDGLTQDLVLTIHHCYMHTLSNTNAIKIIENSKARAMVKNISQEVFIQQIPLPGPPGR